MKSVPATTRSSFAVRRTATVLGVALALGVTGFTGQAALAGEGPSSGSERVNASVSKKAETSQPMSRAVSNPLSLAKTALTRADAQIRANHPARGIAALRRVSDNVGKAHRAAMKLIGAPPVDPESDDPPGPPAVLAVFALEHKVGTRLVPLFDLGSKANVEDALRSVLTSTHHRRDRMLDAITALPPEGDGDAYVDGMSDTLGLYTAEVKQLTTALATYKLSPGGKVGLENALIRVRATNAKVNAAYGGGERHTAS